MSTHWYRVASALAGLALVLTGCGDDEEAPTDTDAPDLGLQTEGMLRVGSDIDFPPFEAIEDGEIVGFDVELMEEIANRLNLEVEWVDTPFDTIFTQLAAGDFDAAISAITITADRRKTIEFSDPYFEAIQSLVVRVDSDITGVADLAGTDVGVQAGTTGEEYSEETFVDATTRSFPTYPAAFTALETEGVDAVLADLPAAEAQVERSDTIQIVEEIDTGEKYGIGVQQDNEALRAAINEQLEAIIADGTYENIFVEWFDGPPPERFRT